MKPRDLSPWPVDVPIPAVLTIGELLRVTRWRPARFFDLKRIGKLPPWIKQLPGTGHPRFCGRTLAKWAAGEWDVVGAGRDARGRRAGRLETRDGCASRTVAPVHA